MQGPSADWLNANRAFYAAQLADVRGPVLDCACGTGLFLLPWLDAGHDVFGFDASAAMLGALSKKADADVRHRLSVQRLQDFEYDLRLGAVCIPTNTFGMLTTQQDQLRTLTNIRTHLREAGRLLLDLRLPGMDDLAAEKAGVTGRAHSWPHPETGLPIKQQISDTRDHVDQLYMNECRIEYEGTVHEFPMWGRWTWPSEFELLLRCAGFSSWTAQSATGAPLDYDGLRETASYWCIEA